jgi:hypothetical protein
MEKLAPGDGLLLVDRFENKRRLRGVRVAVKQQARLTPVHTSVNSSVSELRGAKMEADQIVRHEPPVLHRLERLGNEVGALYDCAGVDGCLYPQSLFATGGEEGD